MIDLKCDFCASKTHLSVSCDLGHYVANRTLIINRINYSIDQSRLEISRYHGRYNALNNFQKIQKSTFLIQKSCKIKYIYIKKKIKYKVQIITNCDSSDSNDSADSDTKPYVVPLRIDIPQLQKKNPLLNNHFPLKKV